MNDSYTPPKVWTWEAPSGGQFASINRPVSGATHDKALPVGRHPFQLYSLATPNGVKVTVMFEELLAAGIKEAEYDAWLIKIGDGDQFGSGFVEANPNSKIPALIDRSGAEPPHWARLGKGVHPPTPPDFSLPMDLSQLHPSPQNPGISRTEEEGGGPVGNCKPDRATPRGFTGRQSVFVGDGF
jgi:hypothetical protein